MKERRSEVFKFKQFDVDQSGCAMKINTDGVLLGVLTEADQPRTILDIGTGTGVIALMLAQRFADARIDAVEIDEQAAGTAAVNFANSPFFPRLTAYASGFEEFFNEHLGKKYDLIVSNPPFYINSLKSPQKEKEIAKHANADFFKKLINEAFLHLNEKGKFCLILPVDTAELVIQLANSYGLFCVDRINVRSFSDSEAHRVILTLETRQLPAKETYFTIYKAVNIYSAEYVKLLQPYFIAF